MAGIAVISAFNCHNYGMYSVDLAADHFFRELGLPFTHVVTQRRTRVGKLRFQLLRRPEDFAGFDRVVYWGDFLNNPMWGAEDYANREMRRHGVRDPATGLANWSELYLNLKRHHPAVSVFALGGCFLGADTRTSQPTRDHLVDFLQSAELVLPRDGKSLEIVRELAPVEHVRPGMDCAWLLPFGPKPQVSESRYFVCFLGRTLRRQHKRLAAELAKATGLQPVWLDWLNLRLPRFVAHWNFNRMHRLIAGARFVVTDTYHLVINALNRGVRTVCLYDASQSPTAGSCGDVKKQVLMEESGFASMLVEVAGSVPLAQRIHRRLQTCDEQAESASFARLAQRRSEFRRELRAALMAHAQPQPAIGSLIPQAVT